LTGICVYPSRIRNSGLLLRFSHTGGTDYYNEDDPRETVPLHDVIPAERKLSHTFKDYTTCSTPALCEIFVLARTTTPPHKCLQQHNTENYCWSIMINRGSSLLLPVRQLICGCFCGCRSCTFNNEQAYC